MTKRNGACLCGQVTFTIEGDVRMAIACHCKQCRRWTGNFWTATQCGDDQLTFTSGEELVTWYRSSDFAKRGFCRNCGANLFYKPHGLEAFKDRTSVSAGVLEDPTGLEFGQHIFCADRGDYYDLPVQGEFIDKYIPFDKS